MQNSKRTICRQPRKSSVCLLAACASLLWCAAVVIAAGPVTASSAEPEKPNSVEQRASVALTAGKSKNAEAIYDLTALLCDDSATVRAAAAWACTQLGEAAAPILPQLTEGLSDLEPRVRIGCATAIGQLGENGAVAEAALVRAVQDRSPDVRCAALIALRAVGIRELEPAIEAIGRAMQASDPQVQSESIATANSLLKRCDPATRQSLATSLFPALTSSSDDVRLAATVLACDLGIDAAPAMTAIVKNADDLDDSIQTAAHQALVQFADSVDRQWNQLDADERELLRRPCDIAAKGLRTRGAASSEFATLAKRFQKLVTGVELTSGEQVAANNISLLESDEILTSDTSVHTEPQRLSNIASSQEKRSWSSAWLWLVGITVAGAAIWLVRLGLKKDETPIFIPAKPEDLNRNAAIRVS